MGLVKLVDVVYATDNVPVKGIDEQVKLELIENLDYELENFSETKVLITNEDLQDFEYDEETEHFEPNNLYLTKYYFMDGGTEVDFNDMIEDDEVELSDTRTVLKTTEFNSNVLEDYSSVEGINIYNGNKLLVEDGYIELTDSFNSSSLSGEYIYEGFITDDEGFVETTLTCVCREEMSPKEVMETLFKYA